MQNGSRDWARKIEQRVADGGNVPLVSRRWAEEVMGYTFIRIGRGARPDVHDRIAGDDSFDDDHERYVVL